MTVMLANIDVVPIELMAGQHVASYDEYVDELSPSGGSGLINSVMKLGDTSEVIIAHYGR